MQITNTKEMGEDRRLINGRKIGSLKWNHLSSCCRPRAEAVNAVGRIKKHFTFTHSTIF